MKNRIFFILIGSLIFSNQLQSYGQSKRLDMTKVVLQSPNVLSLGKFVDNPVNLANGTPQIDIPLHTIKSSEIEIPISLSYHSGGIKVDEESSFVGLGWVLNAGGVITRVIKDRDDFEGNGFASRYNSIPTLTNYDDPAGPEPGGVGNNIQLKTEYFLDKEPDLFKINASGISNSFVMDNTGNYVTTNYEPLKISVNSSTNLITVINSLGVLYRFGKSIANEEAHEITNSSVGNSTIATTSWHLTEIISADKTDTIFFKYKSLLYSNYSTASVNRYHIYDGNSPLYDMRGGLHEGINYNSRLTTITNARILDKIFHKNGFIQILHNSDRLDIDGSISSPLKNARISGFEIFDHNSQKVKYVKFENNAHFDRTAAGHPVIPSISIPNSAKKSLKLNGVKFYGLGNTFQSEYKFEYDLTALPPRNTTSQDMWGYANGNGGLDFIPSTFYTFQPNNPTKPTFVGQNRDPNFAFMKAGSIKRIFYPTGGFTEFEFEPHYYLSKEQGEGKSQMIKSFSKFAINRHSSCDPNFMNNISQNTVFEFTIDEDLGSTNSALLTFVVNFSDYQIYSGVPMKAKIYEVTGLFEYEFQHNPDDRLTSKTYSQTFLAQEGKTYRIELNTHNNSGSSNSPCNSPMIEAFTTYNYWDFTDKSQIIPKVAGGLRIKTIKNFTDSGRIVMQKKYEYGVDKYGPNGVGVGNIISDPNINFYYNYQLYFETQCAKVLKRFINFTSSSQVELGMNNGSPVDYDRITEYQLDNSNQDNNGKIEYFYSRTGRLFEPAGSNNYPYPFFYFPNWATSSLEKTLVYKKNIDNSYSPVRSVINVYSEASEKKIKFLKILEQQPEVYQISYTGTPCVGEHHFENNQYRFFYYNYYTSINRKIKTSEISYEFEDGVPKLESKTDYTYNSNFNVKSQSYFNSKQEAVITNLKYTSDLDYSNLIAANILDLPVQSETILNGKVISGDIILYNDWGKQTEIYKTNIVSPQLKVDYLVRNQVPTYYTKHGQITYYSLSRRIKEVILEDNITTTYLWGYKSTYPIAEITNSSYANIAALLTQTRIDEIANKFPSISIINELVLPLRNNSSISKIQVKTYSHDPNVGMIVQSDVNGINTHFGYDGAGRLALVRDRDFKIIKSICYNYAGQSESCSIAFNSVQNQSFTRECEPGYQGSVVNYIVPANTYSAPTSNLANKLAQNEINLNGQAYANANGTCTLLVCNTTTCQANGPAFKCVNNICEEGIKVYTESIPKGGGQFTCFYHYVWSDGSWSPTYTEYNSPVDCTQNN